MKYQDWQRMSKTKKILPELRFPEFANTEGWDAKTLGEVAERIEEKVSDKKLTTASISAGTGFVSQAEKFSRDISGAQYKNYIVLNEGEFSYNKGNSKRFPQGCIYKLKEFKQVAVPNAFISFRFKPNFIGDFYQGYFDNNYHGVQLMRFITSGARMDGLLNIKADDFFSIVLPTPSKSEQQKIASCLLSLDYLIEAHNQKLELLKEHKKGLIQNLFPQGGEKVPKFRFKDYRNSGNWILKNLENIAENLDSKRVPITSTQRDKGNVPYYGASGIIDHVKDYIFDETLLCISEDGANLIDRSYPIAFTITGKTWVNNHAHVLRFENFDIQILVEQYINSINVEDYLTGVAQPKLNRGNLDIIQIPLPENPKEQQKIAYCLSALDEIIKAQAELIEELKHHKKGLMQRLLPQAID